MENTMNNKILGKVKKCLALAKSSNPNEAAIALKHAQALMRKHNINADDVRLSDVAESSTKAHKSKNPPAYIHGLVSVICKSFGVEAIYKKVQVSWGLWESQIMFIGVGGSQSELAAYAFDVLSRQLSRDRSAYIKSLSNRCKTTTKTRKGDIFAQQWVLIVWEKVAEFIQPQSHIDLIEKYIEQTKGELSKSKANVRKTNSQDFDAALAGQISGENAVLNRAMNESKTQRLCN